MVILNNREIPLKGRKLTLFFLEIDAVKGYGRCCLRSQFAVETRADDGVPIS
jgi:hypothetical protein